MNSPLRILYLEDDVADAELTQDTLEMGGLACDVTRVETESDFLAALQQGDRPDPGGLLSALVRWLVGVEHHTAASAGSAVYLRFGKGGGRSGRRSSQDGCDGLRLENTTVSPGALGARCARPMRQRSFAVLSVSFRIAKRRSGGWSRLTSSGSSPGTSKVGFLRRTTRFSALWRTTVTISSQVACGGRS
jgi:hypothetical protein